MAFSHRIILLLATYYIASILRLANTLMLTVKLVSIASEMQYNIIVDNIKIHPTPSS